jgi:hypothetical protein
VTGGAEPSQRPARGVQAGMRSHSTSITIDAPAHAAFAFLADAERLPVWAIGFAKAIERAADGWVVTLASGERMPLRVDADAATGVIDYVSLPAPGVEVPAHTRVVPHGTGSLYVFSMHQPPDLPDSVFDAQIAELGRELTVLKAHLESACPL